MNDIGNVETTVNIETPRDQSAQQSYRFESLSGAFKSAPPPRCELTREKASIQLRKDLVAATKIGHTPVSFVEVLRRAGLNASQRAVANLVRKTKQNLVTSPLTPTN